MGCPQVDFWSLTLRHYRIVVSEAASLRRSDRIQLAWWTAKLQRAAKMPDLDLLLAPPLTPAERAAEQRAAMAAYRDIAAARGKIKSWDEWLH